MEGKWEVFVKELKMVSFLSAPMVVVSVLQYRLYSLPFVTLMMVGHLDELSLSGVSVAFSFSIVTGHSLVVKSFCLLCPPLDKFHACVIAEKMENPAF